MPYIKKEALALVIAQSLIFSSANASSETATAANMDTIARIHNARIRKVQLEQNRQKSTITKERHAAETQKKAVNKLNLVLDRKPWTDSNHIASEERSTTPNTNRRPRPVSSPNQNQYVDQGRLRGSAGTTSMKDDAGAEDESAPRESLFVSLHQKTVKTSGSDGRQLKASKESKPPRPDPVDEGDPCFTGTSDDVIASCVSANATCCETPEGAENPACSWGGDSNITVCPHSCNGDGACYFASALATTIDIASYSCNGENACHSIDMGVPESSCNGAAACHFNTGEVGEGSCNGEYACYHNTGSLSNNTCSGDVACMANVATIGEGSCYGDGSCAMKQSNVGVNSCIGSSSCYFNHGAVDDFACSGKNACLFQHGDIGKYSCSGEEACYWNAGDISEDSCSGELACAHNSGDISNKACVGDAACFFNSGRIAEEACVGKLACYLNDVAIIAGECVGDYACSP